MEEKPSAYTTKRMLFLFTLYDKRPDPDEVFKRVKLGEGDDRDERNIGLSYVHDVWIEDDMEAIEELTGIGYEDSDNLLVVELRSKTKDTWDDGEANYHTISILDDQLLGFFMVMEEIIKPPVPKNFFELDMPDHGVVRTTQFDMLTPMEFSFVILEQIEK